MKLNARAACSWLAAPLAAIAISACGGDDGVTATPPDSGASPEGWCENAVCGDGILDECETTAPTEECDGTNDCTDQCTENVCGDGFVGAGEDCDDGNDVDGDGCSNCTDPDCGDMIVDEDEECDDGNRDNTDGCSNSCEEARCGDGIVQPATEECDEGDDNGAEDSRCTDTCQENTCGDGIVGRGEACDDMGPSDDCTANCGLATCGDGEMQGNEECDDENGNDRDECLSSCVLNVCGDGFLLAGEEECDDGNSSNRDSCTNTCLSNVCGDGYVGPGELCDEGEDNADDGECTTECTVKTCGDEVVQPGEECDDGNTNAADGCHNCVLGYCGDGIRQTDEQCDDGNTSNGDSCTNECVANICGDTFIGPGEVCDDGNNVDGDGCQHNCALPTCGDEIVDADKGEECDDGNEDDTDGCTNACKENICGDGKHYVGVEDCDDGNDIDTDTCTSTCAAPACGDGYLQPGEGCDDGNNDDGDGCQADCSPANCGDGIVDADEQCDDGDEDETDGCTTKCAEAACGDGFTQAGEECDRGGENSNNGACLLNCTDAECGDGFRNPATEACDDGANNGPGQPCSTQCTLNACGNGTIDAGEDCDDGNNNNNDSCTSLCLWNTCGDGAVYISVTNNQNPNALEECDDMNDNDGDLCLATCRYNRCADGSILTNNRSEPYDDPDGTGPRTASRGGTNDAYHSGGTTPANLNEALLGDCDPGDECRIGMLHEEDVVSGSSGLSTVNIIHIDNEECDDGNNTNTDACLARNEDGDPERECRNARCNDGVVQAGVEQCDDGCGPGIPEDECPALRNQNDSCLDTCALASCGDGWLHTDQTLGGGSPALEACDDGNTQGGDACTAGCTVPTCGNGVIDYEILATGAVRLEECDNGSSNSDTTGATCSTSCTLKNATSGLATCGDGDVDAGEECDDANGDNNDSCLNNCMFNKCGDGVRYIVKTPSGGTTQNPNRLEQCDDGNANDSDSCLATCQWNTCGDNEEYRTETDGFPGDGGPLHGNGLNPNIDGVDEPEGPNGCDDENNATQEDSIPLYDDCNAPGTPDDEADPMAIPEQCDDGNTVNDDSCSNSCRDAVCGDGILQADEACDDGNGDNTDGCLSLTSELVLDEYCDEECDGDDACEAICQATARSCQFNVCGDGFKSPFEACDDGNSNDNDSCRNDCSVSTCGNGVPGEDPDGDGPLPEEECDDGNDNNADNCTNVCLLARCGDGVHQVGNGEECDDGNLDNTDGCTAACTLPVCGDGVRNQATEQCDPGRNINGNDFVNNDEGGGTEDDTGSWLYANHVNESEAPGAGLSLALRDDGYVDEPFFCDPGTCQLRCSAQAGDHGRGWKDGNQWCVFAAEMPGFLNGASEFDDPANGSYTIYNSAGDFEPQLQQSGWAGARAHCQSYGIGADLVVIRNTTDNGQFLTLVDSVAPSVWWWIGLNDTGTQVQEPAGVWRWLDGTPTDSFRNWSGPPTVDTRPDDSGSDEDCAGFAGSIVLNLEDQVLEPAGTWNDLVCQGTDPFFGPLFACEFPLPGAAN